MSATVAQLGARTLRKLGVSVVALSAQPSANPAVMSADVVGDVLRNLGIFVAETDRPAPLATVSLTDLGGRTARAVGLNPLDLLGASSGTIFTRSQIATKVLLKLAIIASDETPLPQDQALALDKVTAVHDSLTGLDFVSWTPDAIPASVVEYYIIMAANLGAAEFGKVPSLEALNTAREMIRDIALSGFRGQALAEQKIQAVHDGLNVLGLVPWPVTAVPSAHAEDYVAIAATYMAPIMGKPVDKEAAEFAASRVRQAGMVRGATARATQKVQTVNAEMQGLGLVSWTLDTIPASMRDAYASAATVLMGDETGKFDAAAYSAQMMRVRMLAMGGPAGQALAEEKVRQTHLDWAARGKVQWTLFNIPAYAERLYVDKAASLLAPEMPTDPALAPALNVGMFMAIAEAAERSLAQITMVPSTERPVMAHYF